MTFRAPLALPALLLEDPDFRPARLAVDDAHHLGAGHKRRAGDELAAVLGEKQHLLEGHVRAAVARGAVNLHRRARRNLYLPSAGLNNRVHSEIPLTVKRIIIAASRPQLPVGQVLPPPREALRRDSP